MPIYQHKETRKRFFFIHVPRTAGRFLQENIKQNGFEPEQSIWKAIDGVETAHLHRELYEKNLDVENIPHISIVRDPLERYISLKSYICHPKGWFRPQVDYVSDKTHVWYFEDGFNDNFSNWLSSILKMKINIKKLSSNHIYNELGQKLTLDYMDSAFTLEHM